MPFSMRNLTKTNCIALLVLSLLASILFAFGTRGYFIPSLHPVTPVGIVQQQNLARTTEATDDPRGVIQLLLRPEGFDSPTLTVAKGRYILILQNRTGLENLVMQMSRVVGNGEKPKDITFDDKKKYRIDSLIDLTPGDYVVIVQGNSEWVCRLTVINK